MSITLKSHCNMETVGKLYQGAVVFTIGDICHRLIGHVQGFGMNEYDELLVEVLFCNKETHLVHHSCLYPLEK